MYYTNKKEKLKKKQKKKKNKFIMKNTQGNNI